RLTPNAWRRYAASPDTRSRTEASISPGRARGAGAKCVGGFILRSRATGQNSTDRAKGATRSFYSRCNGRYHLPDKEDCPSFQVSDEKQEGAIDCDSRHSRDSTDSNRGRSSGLGARLVDVDVGLMNPKVDAQVPSAVDA